MRKSFWLFAIVLSMSLGIRAQAAPREIPDRFNTGVDTDTELTEIPEPGIYGGIQHICDLSFSFVAPVGSYNCLYHVFLHSLPRFL